MRSFNDGKNDWPIEITLGSIKRVLADTGMNLSLPHEPDADGRTLAQRLVFDVIAKVDVIWSLVRPLAEQRAITMDAFFELAKPEIMARAGEMFEAEWFDFFRKLGQPVQAEIIAAAQKMRAGMQDHALQQMGRLDAAQTTLLKDLMTREVDEVVRQINDSDNPGATLGAPSGSVTDARADAGSATSTDAPGES